MINKWYGFIPVLLIVAVMLFTGEQVYSDEGNSFYAYKVETACLTFTDKMFTFTPV